MMQRRLFFVLAALFAVIIVAGGASSLLDAAARASRTEYSEHAGVRALRIDGADDITLRGAPAGSPLRVTTRITEGLRAPERVARLDDGTLVLDSSCPVFFGGACAVDYDIAIPAGIKLRADVGGGDVEIVDLESTAPVELRASAGDMFIDGLRAPALVARTSAGDVRARGLQVDRIELRTSAGDVEFDADAPFDRLNLETSAGDVDATVPDLTYALDANSSAGDVDTSRVRTDPAAPRSIRLRTSAGDIALAPR